MAKRYTVAVLGCGGRGYAYAKHMKARPDAFLLTDYCDTNPAQLEKMNALFPVEKDRLFTDEEAFFAEKRADVLVLATWDKSHVRQCVRAMELGYDVLLEKPVADSREEIDRLLEVQRKTGRKVVVCHVMRYSTPVNLVEEILETGVLGRLMAIDHTEHVAYWHYAQAYVRLHAQWQGQTHPTILAKCCHDLDLIQHFAGAKCKSVSSVGGYRFFTPENAPDGATERCLDCPHAESCPYSAKRVYIDRWKENGCPAFDWPWSKVSLHSPTTEADLLAGIEDSTFGMCPFLLGVEKDIHVADHQMVQMVFENGVTASLKMLFAADPGRRIQFFGTHGEVVLDERSDTIEVKPYGGEKRTLVISQAKKQSDSWGHGGGDYGLVRDLHEILSGSKTDYTSLEESVESHLMGISAEESRHSGGNAVAVH